MAGIDITTQEVLTLKGDDLVLLLRDLATEANGLQALMATASNQIWEESEGHSGQDTLTKRYGCRSSVELIQRTTGEPASAVSARLKVGRQVARRQSLLGEELVPLQEHVASGLESGLLNITSAAHISKVLAKNCRSNPDDLEIAQRCLVQAATGVDYQTGDEPGIPLHADDVRRLAQAWDAGLDPDGIAPSEEERNHKRFLNIGPVRGGMSRVSGLIKAEVAAMFTTIMDTVNNPRANAEDLPHLNNNGHDANGNVSDGPGTTTADAEADADAKADADADADRGTRGDGVTADPTDDRTWGQRRHDVLAMALGVTLADVDLPVLQGTSATIVVEVNEKALTKDANDGNNNGVGWLVDHEGASTPMSMRAVHQMACNGIIQAVVRNSLGKLVGLGSPLRLFTPTQRRGIALRDRGCVIPGCNIRAAWCEVHHVEPHAKGGPTHTDNGVLLCRYHHSTIDTSGWVISMHAGIPFVRPPGWLLKLHARDTRRLWVNYAMKDQTRRIQETLERQKYRRKHWEVERPPQWTNRT